MLKFSLTALLLLVLFVSLGFAALKNANDTWRQVAIAVTVLALCVAVLAAVLCRGAKRTASFGFALFGWVYFLLLFTEIFVMQYDFITGKAVVWLYSTMHPTQDAQPVLLSTRTSLGRDVMVDMMMGSGGRVAYMDASHQHFFAQIAHCLWTMIVGLIGAVIAQLLHGRGERRECTAGV